MSELDELIQVDIRVTDQAPERPNFGTPLIASLHTRFGDRVREYSQADDLLDDGFTTGDPEYLQATAIKAQDPTLQRFKIGRLTTTFTHTLHFIPTNVTPGYVYEGEFQGDEYSYEVQPGDDIADVCDSLVLQLAAMADSTATDASTHVVLTSSTAGAIMSLKPKGDSHTRVLDVTTVNPTNFAADLSAIEDEDPSWYGLLLTLNTEDTILAAATWCEARRKNFFPQSGDWNVTDSAQTNDVGTLLVSGAYTRTAGIWHRQIGSPACAAWATANLAPDPGTYTPAFKTLATIPVDTLRTGERAGITAKKWTRYTRVGGLNITFEGRTPSGRFIDVVRFIDWIESEIQLDLFRYLYVNPKVPFETSGLIGAKGVIENAIRKGLRPDGRGGVANDTPIVVTVPDITETDVTDRGNRILRNCTFSFRLSGALHGIRVQGTVSV